MFANYLAAPFVFLSIFSLYLAWKVDTDYAVWMIPSVVIATLLYVFAPQLNWWWYNRNPPELEPGLSRLLERFSGFYKRLSVKDKQKFRSRIMLIRMGIDWEPMAFEGEAVPPDVQFVLAHQAAMLTLNREKFLFDKFEKVIVYPRPFSTPEHPYDHASELYEPDGCLLFSAEQAMLAFTEPASWYNVALHEYARAYVLTYPDLPYPTLAGDDIWGKLQLASGMPQGHAESVVGIKGSEPLPVAIHHYFIFPERFREVLPNEAIALDAIFRG